MVDLQHGASRREGADREAAFYIGLSDYELIGIQSMNHDPAIRRDTTDPASNGSHAAIVGR